MSRSHRWSWWLICAAVIVVGLASYVGAEAGAVARLARRGRADLVAAEAALRARQVTAAQRDLDGATSEFALVEQRLHSRRTLLPAVRQVPFVHTELKAVDTLAKAGIELAGAGRTIADAVDTALHGSGGGGLGASIQALTPVDTSLGRAEAQVAVAQRELGGLRGAVLLGPLGSARRDATRRVDRGATDLANVRTGLQTLRTVAGGGTGTRTYLLLDQDSAELRATGGDIGSFAEVRFDPSGVHVTRFEDIGDWEAAHPQASLRDLPAPFAQVAPPGTPWPPSLANWSPDFPTTARQFLTFWQLAGEAPVDGVIGMTPEVVVRILGITGPVPVPGYGQVTAANVLPLGYYNVEINPQGAGQPQGRKTFLGAVTQSALSAAAALPRARLLDLAEAMAAAFDHREALVYDPDPAVATELATHRWDGALHPAGDFVMDVETNMTASKNGRLVIRRFDRTVTLQPDGSAVVRLTLRLALSGPEDPTLNPYYRVYVRMLAPAGSTVEGGTAAGWVPDPSEHGLAVFGRWARIDVDQSADLDLVYKERHAAVLSGNRLTYQLVWQKQPGTAADPARNAVVLPAGYHWLSRPPAQWALSSDVEGRWIATK